MLLFTATGAINHYYYLMTVFDPKTEFIKLFRGQIASPAVGLFVAGWLLVCSAGATAQIELEPNSDVEIVIDISSETDEQGQALEPEELTEEEKAIARARAAEISRQLSQRTEAIESLQSEQGIYGPQLQEAYSDLAGFYIEIEDYESAIKLYSDALQVARINTGLYSEEQLPLIRALVRNQAKLTAWGEVDRLHELEYFVASRAFEVGDSSYLEAAETYGEWKLRVVKENVLEQTSRGLLDSATDLSNCNGLAIEKIDTQSNTEPEELLGLISGKTETDLALARSLARTPAAAFTGNASRYVTEARCRNRANAQGQVVRQCVNVQVENPRYRQSQRDAKNMAMRRYTRQIEIAVERLREIRVSSETLSETEKLELDSQIATLETEAIQLQRSERRIFGF